MKKRLFVSFIVITALLFMLSPVVEVAENEREISLNKSVAPLFFSEIGQEIEYEIFIENTGNTDLNEVKVIDEMLGIDELIGNLAPGEYEEISANYVITTEDMEREYVENTASVTGKDPGFIGKGEGQVSAQDSIIIAADKEYQPAISLNKEAVPGSYSEVGDVITYTITVNNTGNVILNDVTVTDSLLGLDTNIGTLDPGEEDTITETYTITRETQENVDEGFLENTASVTGKDARETEIKDSDKARVKSDIVSEPMISITKEPHPETFESKDQEINYTITVTNVGNVALEDVTVVDELLNINQDLGTIAPDDSEVITENYFITAEDMERGYVDNLATVTGVDSTFIGKIGGQVSDEAEAEITSDFTAEPDISITKTADPTTYDAVGDVIEYTITVTNTGNVTLYEVLVEDNLLDLEAEGDIDSLAAGATEAITVEHTITQADLDNGSVTNTAEVTGEDAAGAEVNDSDDAMVTAVQSPDIFITKTAAPTTYDAVGDVITYIITVVNTGNVPLTDVTVTDPLLGLDTNIGTLEPDQVYTLPTQTHTINQDDIDAGTVENTATVEGKDPADESVSDSDDAVVTAEIVPGDTETAWAYNDDYDENFVNLGISGNWGWSNGPLAPEGEYVFELWAGAAQNDLDKGTLVGEVTVSFVEETVQYNMYGDYYLEEVQLYMGNEHSLTAVPGQLGYINENVNSQQDTINFSYFTNVDFDEDIYMAAHAVVGIW